MKDSDLFRLAVDASTPELAVAYVMLGEAQGGDATKVWPVLAENHGPYRVTFQGAVDALTTQGGLCVWVDVDCATVLHNGQDIGSFDRTDPALASEACVACNSYEAQTTAPDGERLCCGGE